MLVWVIYYLNQTIIAELIFFFWPITLQLNSALIFYEKIRSWSIMGVEGLIISEIERVKSSYPFIQLNFVYMY